MLQVVEAVKQPQSEIGRHDEGYSMSGSKKIRREMRIFDPGSWGQKGGSGHHDGDAEQVPAGKAEDGPENAIEEAKANRVDSAME